MNRSELLVVVLTSAAVGAVLAITVVLGAPFGDLAGWVQGIGTVLAFGASYALLRHEVAIRKKDESARASEQARFVAAWPDGLADWSTDEQSIFKIVIWNGSNAPVFWLAMYDGDYGGTSDSERANMVWATNVLKPGEEIAYVPGSAFDPDLPELAYLPPSIELTFSDVSRRSWHWKDGDLTPLAHNPYHGGC
jgi:hypothetical protein